MTQVFISQAAQVSLRFLNWEHMPGENMLTMKSTPFYEKKNQQKNVSADLHTINIYSSYRKFVLLEACKIMLYYSFKSNFTAFGK